MRCQLPKNYKLVKNVSIASAITELSEKEKGQFVFLSRDSLLPFKPSLLRSYQTRQIHLLRQAVLGLLTAHPETNGVLFGSTPAVYRRITKLYEEMPTPIIGAVIPEKCVFSGSTDVDIVFPDEPSLLAFEQLLVTTFSSSKRQTWNYKLQGLVVHTYRIWFLFYKHSQICLQVDLVRADNTVGTGAIWPDFVETQLACRLQRSHPVYELNPLVGQSTFFDSLMKPGNVTETQTARFLQDLIRRLDDGAPWRWCLLRPEKFVRLLTTENFLPNEAYALYIKNMLHRLQKFLARGVIVKGIHIRHHNHEFVLPCGHIVNSLRKIECLYNDATDALEYTCPLDQAVCPLFTDFLPCP
jgi:hypothetical protein